MNLLKRLARKEKYECLSYDNLIGNFKDGEIGQKIRKSIVEDYIEHYNPDKEFMEEFYSNNGEFVF